MRPRCALAHIAGSLTTRNFVQPSKKIIAPRGARGYATSDSSDAPRASTTTKDRKGSDMATPTNKTATDKTAATAAATDKTAATAAATDKGPKPAAAAAAGKPAAPAAAAAATPDKAAAPATSATPDKAAAPATSATPDKAAAPKPTPDPSKPETYKGLPRLRFYSVTPGKEDYCVRLLPLFLDKYGAPKDPWGLEMKLRAKQAQEIGAGADYKPAKIRRLEEKEQEQKLLASMTDEQKLAHAAARRQARAEEKQAKLAAQKAAMMAELRRELEAQGVRLPPTTTPTT